VPPAASREAPTPAGALLDRYAEYLLVRRGVAAETVRGYCNTARAFLADRERIAGDLALGALDVAALNDYLLGRSRRGSIASSNARRRSRPPAAEARQGQRSEVAKR
jgi:site-specific recombinase XerD